MKPNQQMEINLMLNAKMTIVYIFLYFKYHRGEAAEDNNKNINFNIHDSFVCGLALAWLDSALLDGNESHRHNKTFSAF